MTAPSPSHFDFLQSIDTPTVCNLVEIVAPERRGFGYTVRHLHCPFPELAPIVGFAKTVTFKAKDAVALGDAGYMQRRLDYLDYVAASPRPSIMVMEDLDAAHVGSGGSWGGVLWVGRGGGTGWGARGANLGRATATGRSSCRSTKSTP